MPFKWRNRYMCFYCGDDFHDHDSLKTHTKGHGAISDEDRAIKLVRAPDSEVKIDVSEIYCYICSNNFLTLEDIVDHLMLKHKLPYNKDVQLYITAYKLVDLQCVVCDQKFHYFGKLITHMNVKHPSNCFQCDECEHKFNKKRDLDCHIRTHHRNAYDCTICNEQLHTYAALHYHKLNAHPSTCNICFQTFSSNNKRLKHMKLDHSSDQAQCGFCLKTLPTKQAFLWHAAQCNSKHETKHESTSDDNRPKLKDVQNSVASIFNMSTVVPFKYFMNRFRCFYCPKNFSESKDLKNHTLSDHPVCDVSFKAMKLRHRYDGIQLKVDTSVLSCKICFEAFENLSNLIAHLISKHNAKCDSSVSNIMQPFKLDEDLFRCPICNDVFVFFGLLLKHMSKSHTDNKHICSYCGESFRADTNLRAHILLRHRVTGRHKCDDCELDFATVSMLQYHMGSVHGKKLIQCPDCPEKFITPYRKERHMLVVHGTGHKCGYCGRYFSRNSYMVNHIRRLHLKEKNEECSVCAEKFFDGAQLKLHMVKHVGVRKFQCDFCGKNFMWRRNLITHMALHAKKN